MQVTAKSPCRVDLAGGTLDIWPLYLYHANAVTVNFAVSVYTTCRVRAREGNAITLRSVDQGVEETYDKLETLLEAKRHRHPLAAQVIRVPTGCQDYYPAMYGGVSAIELTVAGIRRKPLPVNTEELNSRFVLAYTGKPRQSGINNWEVTKLHIDGSKAVQRNFERIAEISHAMRGALERGDWAETARLQWAEWDHRRKNAPGITTEKLDQLVAVSRKAGAQAAKACGAGGGGCAVFLCEPEARERVAAALEREGARVLNVQAAPKGVSVKSAG